VVQAHQACTTRNNSHRRRQKPITLTRGQERIKLKRETEEPMRARKVASMINLVNQQNPKMNKVKNKEQSTKDSI
jgi:hypothetical protein